MIQLVNFPFCNASSILRFLQQSRLPYSILDKSSELSASDTVLLPGVGTFEEGMRYLNEHNFVPRLREHAEAGGKLVGICLGMQLLMSASEESPGCRGLSLIPGECHHIPVAQAFTVPHIGWNQVFVNDNSCCDYHLKQSFSRFAASDFYFVHSFVCKLKSTDNSLAFFDHPCGPQVASVVKEKVYGFQFHPEKSGPTGYSLLREFL